MAARAWLFDRTLQVDAAKGEAVIAPLRIAGAISLPAMAITPATLLYVQLFSETKRLALAGWLFLFIYAFATVGVAVILLLPGNRRVHVDFSGKRLEIGRPYGLGVAAKASFTDAAVRCEMSTMHHAEHSSPRGTAFATIGADTFRLLDLTGDAAELPRLLVAAIDHGDVETLERATARAGANLGQKLAPLAGIALLGIVFAVYTLL